MGRGDRDESVSPRRRIMMAPVKNLPQQQQHQHHGGGRSASVSPRRNFVPRNASPSPRRHVKEAVSAVAARELDLRLLNVTGDALHSSRRTVAAAAGAGASSTSRTAMTRSRTTPRLNMTAGSSRRSTARSPTRSRRGRTLSAADRERQEAIDRENRILLRKILEQHHGVRRGGGPGGAESAFSGGVPTAASCRAYSPRRGRSSRQINEERRRHRTDYENLILLQKIQNVRPSDQIASSFGGGNNMRMAC